MKLINCSTKAVKSRLFVEYVKKEWRDENEVKKRGIIYDSPKTVIIYEFKEVDIECVLYYQKWIS